MYSRLGRPRWGSVAAVTALTVDAASITLYCVRPQWFGDARVAFRNPERRPEARPLFVAVACLAGLRGLFHAGSPRRNAAPTCEERRSNGATPRTRWPVS